MIVVVQRALDASCMVDGKITGSIEKGFMLLVGFTHTDTLEEIKKMVSKISGLRVFEDENQKLNLSIRDVGGSILSISQFTLYGDCKKGNRPSFVNAMPGSSAKALFDEFNESLRNEGLHVEEGIFGADMLIDFKNYGPVTIILDSEKL